MESMSHHLVSLVDNGMTTCPGSGEGGGKAGGPGSGDCYCVLRRCYRKCLWICIPNPEAFSFTSWELYGDY